MAENARATWLLWTGAAVGLGLAIASIAKPDVARIAGELPPGAVAVVNGQPIAKADYDAELQRMREREHRAPSTQDKRAALQQLIDDELLLERGIELGMVRGDGPTRRSLLSAVYALERGALSAEPPSAAELEPFYREAEAQLEQPAALHLRQIAIRVRNLDDATAARARAEQAARRLRDGDPFAEVQSALGTPGEADALPDRALSIAELGERIGPAALAEALKLQVGEVSAVLGSGALLRVLQLVDRGEPQQPPLQRIRERALRLYELHAAERAFAARIEALRARAAIRVAESLP